jgi:hypothetical protein
MTSDDFLFRLLDSRDLVFSGRTVEEDVSSVFPLPFFEDLLLEAFRGAAEQLATTTAGIFIGMPGRRDRKDLSPQTSENTRLILLLCLTSSYKLCIRSSWIRQSWHSPFSPPLL